MKRKVLILMIVFFSILLLIALAGFIKFNFLDVPFLGDPIEYRAKTGEIIIISERVDESIQLCILNSCTYLLPTKSDSGMNYRNADGSLIFWQKAQGFLIEEDGEVIYQGADSE
jgi:hypothetical protein